MIQGHQGVLEHESDLAASDGAPVAVDQAAQVTSVERQGGGVDLGSRPGEADQGACGDGLAGTRFADDCQALSGVDLERHALHDLAAGERDAKVADLGQRCVGGVFTGGGHCLPGDDGHRRSPSRRVPRYRPTVVNASATATITRPGKISSHQATVM